MKKSRFKMLRTRAALIFLTSILCGCANLVETEPPQEESNPVDVPIAVATPPAPGVETTIAAPVSDIELEINPTPVEAIDLWSRLRRGFAMPDLDTPLVRVNEQWYATRPDYVARMTERASRYLYYVIEEVERRGMPAELALLPFIESAFNPQAISSAKASGMWQFMPATGKHFDLRQNLFRDDRRDILASTRAALDYLGKLHNMFGDWHLALAAYNWGEGNVQRAMARNRKAGRSTNYLSLRMPSETQSYVPKLQAVKNIVLRPEAFALTLPPLENHPYFVTVPIERDIDVDLAIRLAGVSREVFLTLNPQINKPVILAAGTPQVLLPYDNAALFERNITEHSGPLATWTAWVAPRTLRTGEAARQVGMSEAQLCEVNTIPQRMLVKRGSTLLIPRSQHLQTDVSLHLADHATISLTPELRCVKLKAGKTDSVASVAKRYRVSRDQVAMWNKTNPSAKFKAGQSIVVYLANKVPQKSVRTRAHMTPAKRTTRTAAGKN